MGEKKKRSGGESSHRKESVMRLESPKLLIQFDM